MRNLLAVVVVVCVAVVGSARSADEKLVTKVYDVKTLLGERGKAPGFKDTDAVVKLILEAVQVGDLRPGTPGPQLVVRDDGRLEVRATLEAHGEIKDLLEALERLTDLAVDIRAEVIELDQSVFDKRVRPLLKAVKGRTEPLVIAFAEEDKNAPRLKELREIVKAGREVQSSAGRFTNGAEATLSARHSYLTYYPNQGGLKKPDGPPEFVKEGFKLIGQPVVSADRRSVRFKLTEQSTAVTEVVTREIGELNDRRVIASAPKLEDVGATRSAEVEDGGALLFRLAYAPEGKVWVVVLRPTIFIKAEQDEVKK